MTEPAPLATPRDEKAAVWRRRMGVGIGTAGLESSAESTQVTGPIERIAVAREHMRATVIDRLGGDPALLDVVDRIAMSGEEAVSVLADDGLPPTTEQFSALEAVVAFDGTRPSFLLRNDEIDFDSSFSVDPWRTTLDPHLRDLRTFAACVARVELGERHIGTAFLIAPTLALTNRHVAQSIADMGIEPPELLGPGFLDFGREHGAGRATHDRRAIERVLLAGEREIADGAIDHARLDLALLQVAPSQLAGEARDRFLPIGIRAGDLPANLLVGAVGYPANWRVFVPGGLRTQYDEVLARLLQGEAGTKRFAPGRSTGMVDAAPRWSGTHDATTINGNSGSPMTLIRPGPLKASGLHYGGRWSGERTNWAHVLGLCGDAACAPGAVTLREGLAKHGVAM